MRFLPQKRWKKILLIAILVFVIVVAAVLGFVLFKINSDYVSGIDVLNADGSKTALIIYHPGLSSFMKDVTYTFADGLVENDWRVEVTTASSQAPTDLSGYSLLVLGSPVYAGSPSLTIKGHIERVGDLQGIDIVLLVTSGGSDGGAEASMQQTVEEYNGTVKEVVSVFTDDSLDIAEQAGRDLFIAKR
ncbi:MAG: hypothetical protein NWF06_08620 [Candidatus Bathyarchaeota archaeon]|nr:hypothetical protein [Candidatus Bathyarchaeum sp.]